MDIEYYIYMTMYHAIWCIALYIGGNSLVKKIELKNKVVDIISIILIITFLNIAKSEYGFINFNNIRFLAMPMFIIGLSIVFYGRKWFKYIGGFTNTNIALTIAEQLFIYIYSKYGKPSIFSFKINLSIFLLLMITLFILKKLNFHKLNELIIENKICSYLIFTFFSAIYPFFMFVNDKIMTSSMSWEIILVVYNIVILIVSIIYLVRRNIVTNNRLNEAMIIQLENYIYSLESMQEDIRKYNHDYKNLLTGALLQAEDGDYDGVRLYLKDVLDEFEEKLGKQISKNTQLKKIKSNEVKGLLLSKMSKMEEIKIEFHLEVLNEVDRINMKTTDLVRCLGILLDNAIEEVEKLEEKVIKLVILQEEKVTTIMVKNPVTEKVNIQNIYEEGFSTKGEKRGLGLSNYKEIVENYENIVRETISTEREFNQVLKIG